MGAPNLLEVEFINSGIYFQKNVFPKEFIDSGIFRENNPANLVFKQDLMRNHFNNCLQTKKFSSFPSTIKKEAIEPKTQKFNGI